MKLLPIVSASVSLVATSIHAADHAPPDIVVIMVDDMGYSDPGFMGSEIRTPHLDQAPRDKPMFLYVSHVAPHWPLHALPEDIAKYEGVYDVGWDRIREARHARMKELGILAPDAVLSPRDLKVPAWEDAKHKPWEARRMATYAAGDQIRRPNRVSADQSLYPGNLSQELSPDEKRRERGWNFPLSARWA